MTDHPTPPPPDPLAHLSDDSAADFFCSLIGPKETAGYAAGEVIGPYVLREKLGDGGFGIVWLAEQALPIRRRVALKILKLGMDTLEVISRFEQERASLALMDHPNIARVIDAGSTPHGRPYFAMELVLGLPITRYCSEKTLPLEERLRLFQDVCAGVQHAHQKGIIHRDLKPSNILVTEMAGAPVPKIIDFGIAKATTTDRLTDYTFITRHDQLIGSPVYMSPEQADAHPDIDTRSDVYALGALLYELLAGTPPFDAATLHAAGYEEMRRIIREVLPKPPSRVTGSRETTIQSPDLDLIILHALEKDRERRYPSAAALQDDIRRFLNHEPILARAPKSSYLLARWVRRHRVLTTATAIALVALITGGAATWQQKLEAEKQALEANTLLQTMMINSFWANDRIDYVGLTKIRPALTLASRKVESLPRYDLERMRLSLGIGQAYLGLENWPEAIRHLSTAREAAIHHQAVFRTRCEISEILSHALIQANRSEEALTLIDKLIPEFDQELVPDDPSLIYIRQLRAEALAALGRYPESLAAYQEAFQLIAEWPSVPCPSDVVLARLHYPETLRKSGDPAAGLKAARANLKLAKHSLGEVDTLYADVLVACARECSEAGEVQEADGYVQWAWQLYFDIYGPAHIKSIRYKDELLILKHKLGRTPEAIEVWRDTIDVYQSENGKTSPETLEEILRFVDFLLQNKLPTEAIQLTEEALQNLETATSPTGASIRWREEMARKLAEIKASVGG